MQVPIVNKMASYASIASKPATAEGQRMPESDEISEWLAILSQVTQPPEQLNRLVEILRREMEVPAPGFRTGTGQTAPSVSSARDGGRGSGTAPPSNWRSGVGGGRFGNATGGQQNFHKSSSAQSFHTSASSPRTPSSSSSQPVTSRPVVARYQSRFKSTGDIQEKILNTVIGNKLNAFTPLTYNDTRDFIYQIMDSGETEFTRDFIEKVFAKATLEDLYCGLFAKLIAEIAHRYPVMYEEMNKYHGEFMKIFDTVQEDTAAEYTDLVKEKQYRMGYGQFIAELAGLNALEKSQLMIMVTKVMDKIWQISSEENKSKTVEEFIDCLVRLTTSLRDRCPKFFIGVKGELGEVILERAGVLIARSTPRPSLTNKARFGLMDLRDLVN
jgi:hypothetical protein